MRSPAAPAARAAIQINIERVLDLGFVSDPGSGTHIIDVIVIPTSFSGKPDRCRPEGETLNINADTFAA